MIIDQKEQAKIDALGPKNILIVPDISGWIVEEMAFQLKKVMESIGHNVSIKYAEASEGLEENGEKPIFNLRDDWGRYDIIYLMLPSYVPKKNDAHDLGINNVEKKICTTFHGGPGSEGQADFLQREGYTNLRISSVSGQTTKRITENIYINQHKVTAPVSEQIDLSWIQNDLLKLQEGDIVEILNEKDLFPPQRKKWIKNVRIRYSRKGFGLKNIYKTPHGVDIQKFSQDEINHDFVGGYAGWVSYLMNRQRDHRRGHWILQAQNKLGFKLNIAGGLKKYDLQKQNTTSQAEDTVAHFKKVHLNKNINIGTYEMHEMPDFYSGISCYLVPDARAGGPMPVLEAGAMGIPVVTTRCGLCGDMIEHNVHGLVVDSYAEFADAIEWMMNHKEEREQMGRNLQQAIRLTRSWDAVGDYWKKFILGVKDLNTGER